MLDKDPELQKRLEAPEAALREGRVLGPFDTAGAAVKAVKAHARRAHRAFADNLISSPPDVQGECGKQLGDLLREGHFPATVQPVVQGA